MSEHQNCWEYNKCGKGPNGLNGEKTDICTAATEKRLDGVHGGTNAGRACWVVAGTLGRGKIQGVFVKKYTTE